MDLEETSLKKIAADHWAFLDEIEAPMWVDLDVEAKSNYQDFDDGWFYSSHMFHQRSSLQLKAAFAHSGEESASSDVIDINGPSSPKLPSSVSKSRRKHCASKKQGGNGHAFLLNKKHPVKAISGKTLMENSGIHKEIRPMEIRPKLSFIISKGSSSLETRVVVDRDFTKNANGDSEDSLSSKVDKASDSNSSTITCGKTLMENSGIHKEIKPKLSFINSKGTSSSETRVVVDRDLTKNANGDSEDSLSSKVDKANDSNSSTTTCEDVQLQQGNQEVLSRTFGNTRALVSAMRVSLRKSGMTRPASRADASNNSSNRKQSKDSNSVSGKSSAGSSSNPGYDVKRPVFTFMQHKERTTNSRNEAGMIRVTKIKVKDSYVSEGSDVQIRGRTSNSRREWTRNTTKPTQNDAANSKLQSKSIRAKALLPHRVNEQHPLTGDAKVKEKARVDWPGRIVSAGNENSTGRLLVNQKCSGEDIATEIMVRDLQATKQNVRQDSRTRRLKGKISSPSRGHNKHSTNATQRVYLR